MKVIVAGGRDFTDADLMVREVHKLALAGHIKDDSSLVCGMARGADMTAYRVWRDIFDLPINKFPADWDAEPRRAGFIRNTEMAKYADVLIAFWDGKSKGTKHMIDTMRQLGKPVYVINY